MSDRTVVSGKVVEITEKWPGEVFTVGWGRLPSQTNSPF